MRFFSNAKVYRHSAAVFALGFSWGRDEGRKGSFMIQWAFLCWHGRFGFLFGRSRS